MYNVYTYVKNLMIKMAQCAHTPVAKHKHVHTYIIHLYTKNNMHIVHMYILSKSNTSCIHENKITYIILLQTEK